MCDLCVADRCWIMRRGDKQIQVKTPTNIAGHMEIKKINGIVCAFMLK